MRPISNIPTPKPDVEPMVTVLTLYQPYASLVVMGHKRFETRAFKPRYRGRLLIHASSKIPDFVYKLDVPFHKYIKDISALPTGKILGEVTMTDVYPTEAWKNGVLDELLEIPSTSQRDRAIEEWYFGDYSPGRFAWKLENPIAWQNPMPVGGQLNLWKYPEALIDWYKNQPQTYS